PEKGSHDPQVRGLAVLPAPDQDYDALDRIVVRDQRLSDVLVQHQHVVIVHPLVEQGVDAGALRIGIVVDGQLVQGEVIGAVRSGFAGVNVELDYHSV